MYNLVILRKLTKCVTLKTLLNAVIKPFNNGISIYDLIYFMIKFYSRYMLENYDTLLHVCEVLLKFMPRVPKPHYRALILKFNFQSNEIEVFICIGFKMQCFCKAV